MEFRNGDVVLIGDKERKYVMMEFDIVRRIGSDIPIGILVDTGSGYIIKNSRGQIELTSRLFDYSEITKIENG